MAARLAHLRQAQGKADQACRLIEPISTWFTEGRDAADLQEAQDPLDRWA